MFYVNNNFRISLLLCVFNIKDSLPVRNKPTSFLLCIQKIALQVVWYIGCFCKWKNLSTTMGVTCMWLQRIVKITITKSVSEHPEDWFSTNSIIPSANSLKVLAVVTATGKSEISASFLRVDVRDGVGSKIFNNCNLLPWYSCCFYVKHSGRPVIFILRTAAQREGRNNPTVLIC